jgi:RNA polymerase sigma factor (sigma-70 family)
MVASDYRGARGIEFEELEAAARIGLCEAARDWQQKEKFASFARTSMSNQIKDFIRSWGPRATPLEAPDLEFPHQIIQLGKTDFSKDDGRIYEWSSWSRRNLIAALQERWENDELADSPEGMTIAFDEVKAATSAIDAVLIGATDRDRAIFISRFFSEPRQTLESIAREHKISYARTVFIIDRFLKQIRKICDTRVAAAS